jgi:hypothetical protein
VFVGAVECYREIEIRNRIVEYRELTDKCDAKLSEPASVLKP